MREASDCDIFLPPEVLLFPDISAGGTVARLLKRYKPKGVEGWKEEEESVEVDAVRKEEDGR